MSEIYPWLADKLASLNQQTATLPHALLIHGPRGVGKRALGEALARNLMCLNPGPAGACGQCDSCNWLRAGTHPDLRVLDLASVAEDDEAKEKDKKPRRTIAIEQVRAALAIMTLSAHRSRRVILVDPAEALTREATNALLKTLEEPPANALFILISHRPGSLLATIKSRCRLIAIGAPEAHLATRWLGEQGVSNAEPRLLRNSGAPLAALAEYAEGKDEAREQLLRALERGAASEPVALAERLAKVPPADFMRWLQCWLYDLFAQRFAQICRYNADRAERIQALAAQTDGERLLGYMRELNDAARLTEHPLNAQLFFEQQLIAYTRLFERNSHG